MSIDRVAKEIGRFLASDRPEVLCVRGKWGVGKTYAWRGFLEKTRKSNNLARQPYAYVSLFGLNSLDDLRYAVFESTVPPENALTGPTSETFGALVAKGKSIGRKTTAWLGPALSIMGAGDLGTALSKSAFLLVRDQLVCLDDLERAGDGLKPRDVLGLVSFLKEQRNCRVVILLNDEALGDDDRAEFFRLLEKVIDVSLVFAPTPSEAASIALNRDEPVHIKLRRYVEALSITNIRVIKKIERLALILAKEVEPYDSRVLEQAVAACAIAGWVVFEPDNSPSLDFVRNYNAVILAMRDRDNNPTPDEVRWRDIFSSISFLHADDFDQLIFDGVVVGYFDQDRLIAEAKSLDEKFNRNTRNSFAKAWDSYHHSIAKEDDEVIESIFNGAIENLAEIDASNINSTIFLLREFGRNRDADNLAQAYVAALPNELRAFTLDGHHFMPDQPVDAALAAALQARYEGFEDERDPRRVLMELAQGQGWNTEDERLMAQLSSDEFQNLIESTEGPQLRAVVKTALRMAEQGGESAPQIKASLHEALSRIAAKSPLRARRLRYWGFAGKVDPADAVRG
jgi:hypothetical protein